MADALQVARARILRYLEQRRVIALDPQAESDVLTVSEELAERDPALAQLAAAAVSGLAPAGPELRRKPRELAFAGRPGVVIEAPLSVREAGFSLHAATRAGGFDEGGREALLKYIRRPGSTALLRRVLAPAAKWRPLVVPKPAPPTSTQEARSSAPCETSPCPESIGSRYRPWAELLKRTFAVDVETCPRCGGRMRLLAVVTEPQSIARFLRHRGEPTEPPARAPPRDPPYFKTLVVRRRPINESSPQGELFEEH